MWEIGPLCHKGKAKEVYEVLGQKNMVCLKFKDSLSAFNGEKQGGFLKKGEICRDISSHLFEKLEKKGVLTHFLKNHNSCFMFVKKLDMIALEVVIRNFLAGSTAKKFKKKQGEKLSSALFELYYKEDSLSDPLSMNLKLCG